MNTILHLIDHSGLCSMVLLAGLLIYIGEAMVRGRPTLHRVGLRAAAAAFIGYCVYGGLTFGPTIAADWLLIVVRALLAGGLMLGVSWIVMPAMGLAWWFMFEVPAAKASRLARASARQTVPCQAPPPTDQELVERRRAETEQHARECQQADEQAEAERRRDDARARAILSYSLFAAKIGTRFTRQMLDDYLATYMADQHLPDDVERRGQELLTTLQQHLDECDPPEQKRTLEDLAQWFQQQKQRIQDLPIDDRARHVHIATLNTRYAELSSQLLEDFGP